MNDAKKIENLEKENKQLLEAAGYHMTTAMKLRKEIGQLEREVQGMSETWASPDLVEKSNKAMDEMIDENCELEEEIERLEKENKQNENASYWLLKKAGEEIEELTDRLALCRSNVILQCDESIKLKEENELLKKENECTDPSYWLLKDAEREIEKLKEENEKVRWDRARIKHFVENLRKELDELS